MCVKVKAGYPYESRQMFRQRAPNVGLFALIQMPTYLCLTFGTLFLSYADYSDL